MKNITEECFGLDFILTERYNFCLTPWVEQVIQVCSTPTCWCPGILSAGCARRHIQHRQRAFLACWLMAVSDSNGSWVCIYLWRQARHHYRFRTAQRAPIHFAKPQRHCRSQVLANSVLFSQLSWASANVWECIGLFTYSTYNSICIKATFLCISVILFCCCCCHDKTPCPK